ncbi:hypothetical protein [Kribbella sp. NPDC050470]|uniref:hypothetical protein n=1 Tax=unclassified Kribbella TaxID=2644121 RepID=UPI0037B37A35
MTLKRTLAVAAAAGLLGSFATASVSTAAPAAACTMTVGSITSGGDIGYSDVTATAPVTARQGTGVHIFSPGIAKISSTWTRNVGEPDGPVTTGEVLLNDTIYNAWYGPDPDGPVGMSRAGTGFGTYIVTERASYLASGPQLATYRLRGDGVLYRYAHRWDGNPTSTVTRYTGFAAVKTMALISETKAYDTFLANTRGGALYTIRFPRTGAPVVKKVRTSTWQTLEHLVAEKCGAQSTLLTAIDKDTGSAYLYAVGHANGTATVIKGLGKIPGTYKDPVYYLRTTETNPPLFGE